MHDAFADIAEADLRAIIADPSPAIWPTASHAENPADLFLYDKYDWRGFNPKGQVTIRLTQGYFTFIGEEDVEKLAGRKVCVSRKLCPRTGVALKVRALLSVDNRKVPLHRFLMDARPGSIIDHVNNLPLDNRRLDNLYDTSSSGNNANRFYERSVNKGMERGVKPYGKKFRGRISHRGEDIYSELFDTEAEAHGWYLTKHKEFHGSKVRPERTLPIFPPRRAAYIPHRPSRMEEALVATF